MTNAVAVAQYGGLGATKNRIINGAMMIDQRNAGASLNPSNGQYSVDRWLCYLTQLSKFTVQQSSTAPAGFTNSLLVTSSSAYSVTSGDLFNIGQFIEGYNIADLGWGSASAQSVTLSFWVRSSLTGIFGGVVRNTGGGTRSYPFTYTISSANTWEQKTITIAGDTTGAWNTTNGQGIGVLFDLGVGSTYRGTAGAWANSNLYGATGATSIVGTSGATFYITGVQLEEGTTATAFEQRLYGTELALCQRYYEVLYADSAGECIFSAQWSTGYRWVWQMKVSKRTNASFSLVGSGNWQVNTPSVTTGFTNIGAYSATGIYYLQGTANTVVGAASAEL